MDNVWESKYKQREKLWSENPDAKLMQYFDLVMPGKLLDLGIGEGRNSIPFALNDFKIDGVDFSETAIKHCKERFHNSHNIDLKCCDLREYSIKRDNYSLIIASNVLNFFKKSELDEVIKGIKDGLKKGGIVYLCVFSTLEPNYKKLKNSALEVEENTFFIEKRNIYKHFFTKEEIKEYFSDFELLCICEGLEYDNSHDEPHYHGGIEFMARKK